MKRIFVERSIVIGLFLLVLTVFSFAERDTRKMFRQHNVESAAELSAPPATLATTVRDGHHSLH